ncbi:PilZ domain-containing protein [Cellulomonas soli]|uniref:PilZ domain-containing protein n=1 Tax=Cellulomonas soli TaxID=931535 RepID=UPI003F83A2E8
MRPCTVAGAEAGVTGHIRSFDGRDAVVVPEALPRGLTPGMPVRLRVMDDVRGECHYGGYVVRVGAIVEIGSIELESVVQKRDGVRVGVRLLCIAALERADTHLPGDAADTGEPADEHTADDEDPADEAPGRSVGVTVLDLSANGTRLTCTARLDVGDILTFDLPAVVVGRGGALPLHVQALVVRTQSLAGVVHYGCRFVGLDERSSDHLYAYVARTQREQRRVRAEST